MFRVDFLSLIFSSFTVRQKNFIFFSNQYHLVREISWINSTCLQVSAMVQEGVHQHEISSDLSPQECTKEADMIVLDKKSENKAIEAIEVQMSSFRWYIFRPPLIYKNKTPDPLSHGTRDVNLYHTYCQLHHPGKKMPRSLNHSACERTEERGNGISSNIPLLMFSGSDQMNLFFLL